MKEWIATDISISFENGYKQVSGNPAIYSALRRYLGARGEGGLINDFLHVGRLIASAMPQAISIDNFMDAHNDNEKLIVMGKLGIITSILNAERRSKIYSDPRIGKPNIDFKKIENTWYSGFFKTLTENCLKQNINRLFDNVKFIIFNYDRCIEHYLYHAIQNYYFLNPDEAAEIMANAEFYHPYGVVGSLPWLTPDGGQSVAFGGHISEEDLVASASSIRTFTESTEGEAINEMRHTIEECERIVFLGFSYLEQNLRILKPDIDDPSIEIVGTSYGISTSNRNIIEAGLQEVFPRNRGIRIDNENECNVFWSENHKLLAS